MVWRIKKVEKNEKIEWIKRVGQTRELPLKSGKTHSLSWELGKKRESESHSAWRREIDGAGQSHIRDHNPISIHHLHLTQPPTTPLSPPTRRPRLAGSTRRLAPSRRHARPRRPRVGLAILRPVRPPPPPPLRAAAAPLAPRPRRSPPGRRHLPLPFRPKRHVV